MSAAIRGYDPDFEVWTQDDYAPGIVRAYNFSLRSTPAAIIGDFNGDGVLDAYLTGHDKTNVINIAVLSSSSATYTVAEMGRGRLDEIPDYVYAKGTKKFLAAYAFQPKGSRYDCGGDAGVSILTLKNDGVAIETIYRDEEHNSYLWIREVLYWDAAKRMFSHCALREPDSTYPSVLGMDQNP